ncbi:MAG: MerR family transcriptional regulator [Candidatus Xenobiia bacterium LiM19]
MARKVITGSQLPLFPDDIFYVSQRDAAIHLNINTRIINYWETQELLHPELARPKGGKGRKYTPNDMVELRFIKGMIVDQGYTIPALKEKLEKLESPYYYNPEDLFWDLRDKQWKTREGIAQVAVRKSEKKLKEALSHLYEKLELPVDKKKKEEFVHTLLEIIRTSLEKT